MEETDFVAEILKKEIDSIVIELVEKFSKKKIVRGLFKGIVKQNNDNICYTFVLIEYKNKKNKRIITGLNITHYDLLSIQIFNNYSNVSIFATKNIKDQDEIAIILDLCLETLRIGKKTLINDNQIVNTFLFTDICTIVEKKKIEDTKLYNNINYMSHVKKEPPKPTFFESGTILATEVEKMKFKLSLVLTNKFIPLVPKVNDGPEEKVETTVTNKSYYCSAYGY